MKLRGTKRQASPWNILITSFLYQTLDFTETRNVHLSLLANADHASADDEPGEKELKGLELDARYRSVDMCLNWLGLCNMFSYLMCAVRTLDGPEDQKEHKCH